MLKTNKEVPRLAPLDVAEKAVIGGHGPVAIGYPVTAAGEIDRWIREAGIDINMAYVTTPGTLEDLVFLSSRN